MKDRTNKSVGGSWEEDAIDAGVLDVGVLDVGVHVSKCLEYFRSFKLEQLLNFHVFKFGWAGENMLPMKFSCFTVATVQPGSCLCTHRRLAGNMRGNM